MSGCSGFDSCLPILSSSDMGLGKTLQSICMLAGDHTQRKNAPPEVMESILSQTHTMPCLLSAPTCLVSSQVSYRITYLLLSAPTCLVECPTMLHTSWSVHKLWCVQVSLGSPLEGVLPSLVVCPPTLTGHWCYEVDKFCPSEHLRVLHYAGNIGERLL